MRYGERLVTTGQETARQQEVVQSPDLERLIEFEQASWPEGERATVGELEKRLAEFPEGIFMLEVTETDGMKKDVSQVTMSPKLLPGTKEINSFTEMRDLPVDRKSPDLWITNMASRPEERNKGYMQAVLVKGIEWAKANGYRSIQAGVTCDGFRALHESGRVKDIQDYHRQGFNPALRAAIQAASTAGVRIRFSEPIPDYWSEDVGSEGYGVLVTIELSSDYEEKTEVQREAEPEARRVEGVVIDGVEAKYTVDISETFTFFEQRRQTVTGPEDTLFVVLPVKGCSYNCEFCSLKHIKNPNLPVNEVESARILRETEERLATHADTDTVKFFNAGNTLYGSERGKAAELHEYFWEELSKLLEQHAKLKAVEVEVRVDEFYDADFPLADKQGLVRQVLRERLVKLANELRERGKELRVILPLEYVSDEIAARVRKFPKKFMAGEDAAKRNALTAIRFLKKHNIPFLSYAMLGGRILEEGGIPRALTEEEAVTSCVHTLVFALQQGAREAIVNSQYLDPFDQEEERRDAMRYGQPVEQVGYHVPSAREMIAVFRGVLAAMPDSMPGRVRITPEGEDIVEGTIDARHRAGVTDRDIEVIQAINNAENQREAFKQLVGS